MMVSDLTNLGSNVHSPSLHLITTSVRDQHLGSRLKIDEVLN